METTSKKPKSAAWRIAATAFKEFWFPLCAAIGLAIWGVSGDQLKAVQGYFFGFLMLAWFTGQIVRIRREIERKDSANETLTRLTTISEKLEAQVQAFIGHSTGGDSHSKIHPLVRRDNGDVDFAIAVTGQYPVRDVDVLSQDLEVDPPYSTARHGHHEVIWPDSLRIALAIEMGADAVDIGKTIHPHPTLGESIGMAAEVAHGSCTDVPPARK
jgi:hypothetical protein